MNELFILILIFLIGIVAGFLGAIIGGGGLISIPFLMFTGLPPQMAIATNKLGSIGFSIGAIIKYFREKKIVWKLVLPLSLIAIFGAYIGANLLLKIDQKILSLIITIIILSFLPIIFLRKKLGIKRRKTSKTKQLIGYVLYFLIMIYAGFFGGGAGILIVYTIMMAFGLTIIETNATDLIPWLAQSVIALVIFAVNDLVNYLYGIILFAGMLIGAYAGARTAVKKGDKWVKTIFIIIIIASVIKLIFFN